MKNSKLPNKLTFVASRSHMNEETNQFINSLTKNNDFKVISFGSSLKICKVAEGLANIYPRFGPTMEWDTAAGHAIASIAGCSVTIPNTNYHLKYNKKTC